jgi:hypothetical protein
MLGASDPGLDGIRYNVRSGLEPVLNAFDEQFAAVDKAHRVTLTDEGARLQREAIQASRHAAISAVLDPAREDLQAFITKTDDQIAAVVPQVTDADRDAAADIAYRIGPMLPTAALTEIARELGEAVTAKDFGRVTALLPYLDSLADDPKYASRVEEVQGLIEHVRAVSTSWQVIVARARRERLDRLSWELQSLSAEIFNGAPGVAQRVQSWLGTQPGWNITTPPPRVSDTSTRRGPNAARDFKVKIVSPEQRAADKAARRKFLGQDEE